MAAKAGDRYYIPDLLANWRWPRHLNPHYEACAEASRAWAESFKVFSAKGQKAFDKCNFPLVGSLAYPLEDKEGCRMTQDLIDVFFVVDEHTDFATAEEARRICDGVMEALRYPEKPRPEGEWLGFEMSRQLGETIKRRAYPAPRQRFLDTFQNYLNTVILEAKDREDDLTRTMEEYLSIRRDNAALPACFAVLEFGMQLPDEARTHPVILEMSRHAMDMIVIDNDIISWNVEQSRSEHDYNCVDSFMRNEGMGLQEAINAATKRHAEAEEHFMDLYNNHFPTFGEPVDSELRTYVDGVANWVRANDQFGWESERYFGKMGMEIMRTRWATVLPKKHAEPATVDIGPTIPDAHFVSIRPSMIPSFWRWGMGGIWNWLKKIQGRGYDGLAYWLKTFRLLFGSRH